MTQFWYLVRVKPTHSLYGECEGRVIAESTWNITQVEIVKEGKAVKAWIENGFLDPVQTPTLERMKEQRL